MCHRPGVGRGGRKAAGRSAHGEAAFPRTARCACEFGAEPGPASRAMKRSGVDRCPCDSLSARHLGRIDQSGAPPAGPQEPGACSSNGGWILRRPLRGPRAPSLKPSPRRGRIDRSRSREVPPELRGVPSRVEQYVGERVPGLSWRAEDTQVESIREDGTSPSEHSVHGSGEPGSEGLHPTGELRSTRRLNDQVHVVRLDRILHEPEPPALSSAAEARLHFAHEAPDPKRRDAAANAQCHMAWMTRRQSGAAPMGIAPHRPRPSPRAGSAPSPAQRRTELQRKL